MISARTIVITGLSCLGAALLGFALVAFGYAAGRLLVFVAVPIGALVVMGGAIAAQGGQVKDDLRKK